VTDPDAPPSRDFGDGLFGIIGGASGIGGAIAAALVARGASVAITSRDAGRADGAAAMLGADHATALDPADADAVDAWVEGLAGHGVPLLGLVNGSGSILLKPAHLTTPDEFMQTLQANLVSAFNVVRAAGRHLAKSGGGSVLLFSTAAAEAGLPNHEAIAAAKGGVAALVRSAAATYASRGVRFNAIAPGLVNTPMAEGITARPPALEASRKMHALGRIGEPEDVARAAMTFLDPKATWISGEVLCVDGGLARLRGR